MTIDFIIVRSVAYGEQMMLNIPVETDDNTHKIASLGMSTTDGCRWTYRLAGVDKSQVPHVDYFFSFNSAGKEQGREWMVVTHRLDLNLVRGEHVIVEALWHDESPAHARLYTSAYTTCIDPRPRHTLARTVYCKTLRLVVCAPQIRSNERLALVPTDGTTSDFDATHAMAMTEHSVSEWQVDLNAATIDSTIRYRFVAIDADGGIEWECATGRTLYVGNIEVGQVLVKEVPSVTFNRDEEHLRGESVRMSALTTPDDCGIGDFGTIAEHLLTLRSRGLNMLMLPPLNDTIATHTTADANPYSSISVFALHPILTDLRQLPEITDDAERDILEEQRRQVKKKSSFDYITVLKTKLQWLRIVFLQDGDRAMHSAAFRHFFVANERWLVPYAQYCYLRDAYATPDFRSWPNHREWTEAERGQLQNPRTKAYKKLAFFYYVQFVLHCQLLRLHTLAREQGIVLRGDLTANINPCGCDMWHEGVGVDDDMWWHRRLQAAAVYYDACHVTNAVTMRPEVVQSTRLLLET